MFLFRSKPRAKGILNQPIHSIMTTQNTPTSEEQQQQELRKKFRELLEASLADIDRAYEEQQHIQEELLIQGSPVPSVQELYSEEVCNG